MMMTIVAVCTFLLAVGSIAQNEEAVACSDDDNPPRFEIFPGKGYNIALAAPLEATDHGIMSGIIFKPKEEDWKQKKSAKDADGCRKYNYMFPEAADTSWTWSVMDSWQEVTVSSAINSQKSYVAETSLHLKEEVSVGFMGLGITCSASQDFKDSTSTLSKDKSVQQRVYRQQNTFILGLNPTGLDAEAEYWTTLIEGYHGEGEQRFQTFIDNYGTHIITRILAGARATLVSTYTENNFELLSSSSKDFTVGLEASYEEFSTNDDADYKNDKKEEKYVTNMATTRYIHCIGGGSGNCPSDPAKWNDEVLKSFQQDAWKNPARLDLHITGHYKFITSEEGWTAFEKAYKNRYPDDDFKTKLDKQAFGKAWKAGLKLYCKGEDSVDNCKPASITLTQKRVDYTQENIVSVGSDVPEENFIPLTTLLSSRAGDWLNVENITMACSGHTEYPIAFQLVLGDHVHNDFKAPSIPSSLSERCIWDNGINGAIVSLPAYKCYKHGEFSLEQCKETCESQKQCKWIGYHTGDSKCCTGSCTLGDKDCLNEGWSDWTHYNCNELKSYSLQFGDSITGIKAKMDDSGTFLKTLMFDIKSDTGKTIKPFGCSGKERTSSFPIEMSQYDYRLLNYAGNYDEEKMRITGISFKFYKLADEDTAPSWSAIKMSNAYGIDLFNKLGQCVQDMFDGTLIAVSDDDSRWSSKDTKTGYEVCDALGLGVCSRLLDNECKMKHCSSAPRNHYAVACYPPPGKGKKVQTYTISTNKKSVNMIIVVSDDENPLLERKDDKYPGMWDILDFDDTQPFYDKSYKITGIPSELNTLRYWKGPFWTGGAEMTLHTAGIPYIITPKWTSLNVNPKISTFALCLPWTKIGEDGFECQDDALIAQVHYQMTLSDCYNLCERTEGCKYITFFKYVQSRKSPGCKLMKQCADLKRSATQPSTSYKLEGCDDSSLRLTTFGSIQTYTSRFGTMCRGNNPSWESQGVIKTEDCQALCTASAECTAFDMDPNTGTGSCYLHFTEVPEFASAASTVTCYIKNKPESSVSPRFMTRLKTAQSSKSDKQSMEHAPTGDNGDRNGQECRLPGKCEGDAGTPCSFCGFHNQQEQICCRSDHNNNNPICNEAKFNSDRSEAQCVVAPQKKKPSGTQPSEKKSSGTQPSKVRSEAVNDTLSRLDYEILAFGGVFALVALLFFLRARQQAQKDMVYTALLHSTEQEI